MGNGKEQYREFVKTPEQINIMREGGQILAKILAEIQDMIKPGVNVWDLETKFINLCSKYNVIPACKNYAPQGMPEFPTGLCASINSQSVHCFPKKDEQLKEGDIITIDTTTTFKGLNVDSAFAKGVGKISNEKQKLLDTTKKARDEAILLIKDGVKIGNISHKIQTIVEEAGFSVLKDYAGHGIGKEMHEWPEIPCYGNKDEGPELREGLTICIEPLVCSGSDKITHENHWETRIADGGNFCQFEHTVLVKKHGYEILTKIN